MSSKDLAEYIDDIVCLGDISLDDIVVEHRSNNPKRDFLFVNKNQAKHIPAQPKKTLGMIKDLANVVSKETIKYKSILVIAFAETATAIGNLLADNLQNCSAVMQTTRENIPNSYCILTFEEEHSHATTHKLLWPYNCEKFKSSDFDYVLFVDDEITTGNTILNFIHAYQKQYSSEVKFGVASICNWQDKEHTALFAAKNIDTFSLLKGHIKDLDAKMNVYSLKSGSLTQSYEKHTLVTDIRVTISRYNERLMHKPLCDYTDLFKLICSQIDLQMIKSVRIIGTEEFMYIPIMFGRYLESKLPSDAWIRCHATTRSHIDVTEPMGCEGIRCKDTFSSVYDLDRKTYLYNLDKYTDVVFVLTDGSFTEEFKQQIQNVCNSSSIYFVRIDWRKI